MSFSHILRRGGVSSRRDPSRTHSWHRGSRFISPGAARLQLKRWRTLLTQSSQAVRLFELGTFGLGTRALASKTSSVSWEKCVFAREGVDQASEKERHDSSCLTLGRKRGVTAVVTYIKGSLFESPAQVLVNSVNTVGAMGKGIAREFKRIYPEMFRRYQQYCESGQLDVGRLMLYKTKHKWILNFPTKKHWRQPSKLSYIELGLQKFVDTSASKGITSVAFPQLGCGHGELDWETQVQPLMEFYLSKIPINVFIYLYSNSTDGVAPEHRVPRETAAWLRQEPASLPFAEVVNDLRALLARQTTFNTVPGNSRFECYARQPCDAGPFELELELLVDGQITAIESFQLYDLWQLVRDYGICTEHIMPSGLQPLAPYVQGVMTELPYIKIVEMLQNEAGEQRSSVGLQIVRPPADTATDPAHLVIAETSAERGR